jgi:hypothetical protein
MLQANVVNFGNFSEFALCMDTLIFGLDVKKAILHKVSTSLSDFLLNKSWSTTLAHTHWEFLQYWPNEAPWFHEHAYLDAMLRPFALATSFQISQNHGISSNHIVCGKTSEQFASIVYAPTFDILCQQDH